MFELTDRVAVVTGAGSGLGRAIAMTLAAQGAKVGVIDLDPALAQATAEAINQQCSADAALAAQADVSVAGSLNDAVSQVVDQFGQLDIMVNNAGIIDGYLNVDQMDESVWRKVLDVDLTGMFLGSKRALQEMLPKGHGRIINMASIAGLNGSSGGAAYISAKHGVVGLTRQMAVTYSGRGITVNCVCPGSIPTDLRKHSQTAFGAEMPDMTNRGLHLTEEGVRARIPAGFRGDVSDVAAAVCYLASDEARYVSGHTLVVDGGITAS